MRFVMVVVIYTVRVYLFVAYRPKIEYVGESVKSPRLKTPSVIIANHTSMLDPLMMLAIFFRKKSIVVAKDQVEDPHFSWALTRIKCVIPCDRFNLDTEWALRSTGAPVVSVGLDGIYKFGHRTRVVVGESEKIERVKGVPSSKHLAERSEYFRQKVWTLKQKALGVAEAPVLPVAAETPEEVQA